MRERRDSLLLFELYTKNNLYSTTRRWLVFFCLIWGVLVGLVDFSVISSLGYVNYTSRLAFVY